MNLKTKTSLSVVILMAGLTLTTSLVAATDTDSDGVPDMAEPLIHTDPLTTDTDGDGLNDLQDDNPVFLANPIKQNGTPPPFSIREALVENNYDYTARKDATDHLEVQIANNSTHSLSDFSIYYTIKDLDNGTTEAYYKKLNGFSVPANGDKRIHIDDSGLPGHFRANPNGIYTTSQAMKLFQVELKANGYAPVKIDIKKDAGGAEEVD